jgi:hypothetical protein
VPRGEPVPARGGAQLARRGLRIPLAAALVVAVLLGGCANRDALGLARRACQHVDRSIALWRKAAAEGNRAQAMALRSQSLEQLRAALPEAAIAAGEASQWQALMTTLAESSRVPESDLLPALEAQCAAARTPFNAPVPPSAATAAARAARLLPP